MIERARISARGAVQGVGFRPFVHNLARELGLAGWVVNSASGATVEVEGPRGAVAAFVERLRDELPPPGYLSSIETSFLDPIGHAGFEIRPSDASGAIGAVVLPDLATCGACLREVGDPANRRHRYPFTNCTHCGPRFTIVEALPYDRPATTMKRFTMCARCAAEYADPTDRRFHAQPNACAECGPRLALWDVRGGSLASAAAALAGAGEAIRDGRIVAVKGLGGFHLICDARSEAAVSTLRERKHRLEKPLAVLVPDLAALARLCEVSESEARLLASPPAPIVLLARRAAADIAPSVAPGNPYLGAMLPMTPLHHLLMRDLGFPVVATSGNFSDEPICTDEYEAVHRLDGIADLFLVHDRPIARHVDDSVVRVVLGRELVLRRARGYAPLPIALEPPGGAAGSPRTVLAVGAHLKNSVALAIGDQAFVSQHIGDLETPEALAAFRDVIASLEGLYRATPDVTVADLHPDYLSTQHALAGTAQVLRVQHHAAHIASCAADNQLEGRVLGVAWDGTGLGPDGTIWGGEFLMVNGAEFRRVAALRPFRLPGGDAAAREPRRAALGILYATFGEEVLARCELAPIAAFDASERAVLGAALAHGVHAPITTSAGRLFDAIASLADLRQRASFEGQAAMELEWACAARGEHGPYPLPAVRWTGGPGQFAPPWMLDWVPLVMALLDDRARGVPAGDVASGFHAALAGAIVAIADRVGEERVVLSGGCFQNRVLLERTVAGLERAGHKPYWHQRVPPNDGGLALGQVALARHLARD